MSVSCYKRSCCVWAWVKCDMQKVEWNTQCEVLCEWWRLFAAFFGQCIFVVDILKDADLTTMSSKKVRLQLSEKYGCDLQSRYSFYVFGRLCLEVGNSVAKIEYFLPGSQANFELSGTHHISQFHITTNTNPNHICWPCIDTKSKPNQWLVNATTYLTLTNPRLPLNCEWGWVISSTSNLLVLSHFTWNVNTGMNNYCIWKRLATLAVLLGFPTGSIQF